MTYRYGVSLHPRNRDTGGARSGGFPRVAALAVALVALSIGTGGSATAQQAPARDTLGGEAGDTVALPLDPLVVTVSRLPLQASRAGFSVSVIPETRLEAERAPYAYEVLRELPGAFIDEAVGPGGPAIIRLRGGEEVFTQILMDGVQMNENGGFFDLQGVTLTNVGRIEVARGPQSALYGSSAVSGVVQFITPPGEQGPVRLGGSLEGGAAIEEGGNFRGSAIARGGSERLLYSAGTGIAYNRGIYDLPHDTWTRDASLRLDAAPADRFRVTGIARFIGVESMHPVRDAGVTRVPLDPNARLERDRYVMTGRARFDASPRWSHGLSVSAFRQDFVYIDERDDIQQPPDFFVVDADLEFDSDLWRTTAEYLGSYTSGSEPSTARFAVAYGAGVEREDLRTGLSGDFGEDEAEFDRVAVTGFTDIRARAHPRLDLMLGARVERYEGLSTQFTPRGSVVLHLIPDRLSIRGAAGRAYKVPNLQEQFQNNPFIAPNPDLDPETSVSWEAGADLEWRRLSLSGTGFHQRYENLIRTVPTDDDRLQNRNIGESRAWGVETRLGYRLAPELAGGVELTRTWTEILDNTGLPPEQYPLGEGLPFRPELIASGWTHAMLHPRIELLTRATWFDRQTVLTERFSGRREELDGYLRVDGTLQYLMTESRSLYLRAENLLNAEYQTGFDRPGIPLTLTLGFAIEP